MSFSVVISDLIRGSMLDVDPYSQRLLDVVDRTVDEWLSAKANAVLSRSGAVDDPSVAVAVGEAARTVRRDLADLLTLDVYEQRRNPLEILRSATRPLTDALRSLGIEGVDRDEFQRRSFPDDLYDLCPATWLDVHPDLVEVGLEWGAWKAATVLTRRRPPDESPNDESPNDESPNDGSRHLNEPNDPT